MLGTLWTPGQLDSLAASAPTDGSEELAVIAASAGYRAGLQGMGMCPYSHRLLRDAWAVGWQAGSGRCTCGAPLEQIEMADGSAAHVCSASWTCPSTYHTAMDAARGAKAQG